MAISSSLKSVGFSQTVTPFDRVQTVMFSSSITLSERIEPGSGGSGTSGSSSVVSTYGSISMLVTPAKTCSKSV